MGRLGLAVGGRQADRCKVMGKGTLLGSNRVCSGAQMMFVTFSSSVLYPGAGGWGVIHPPEDIPSSFMSLPLANPGCPQACPLTSTQLLMHTPGRITQPVEPVFLLCGVSSPPSLSCSCSPSSLLWTHKHLSQATPSGPYNALFSLRSLLVLSVVPLLAPAS